MSTLSALPEIDPALLPGDDDIAFFRAHGWWMSQPIYSEEELDRAIDLQDRFYAGERPQPLPDVFPWKGDGQEPDPCALRKNDYSAFVQPELQLITHKPVLAAIAAVLMGSEAIRLWHDQLLCKPPLPTDRQVDGLTAVGWHADRNYWRTCSGPLLTAWVPFTEVTPEMGPIAFLDRSNDWELIEELNFFSDDLAGQEAVMERLGKKGTRITPHFRRGQVSFHDWRTVHGSTPNLSDRPRRSMAVHMQAGENRWRESRGSDGTLRMHGNDHLCRRDEHSRPDYCDPRWCPRLYPAPRNSWPVL